MSSLRLLSLAIALVVSLTAARGHASGEVRLLRARAELNLGRTPTEGLTFDLLIKNLAYAKHVTVHLTDGSGVWSDIEAVYVGPADSQTERWQAQVRYYDPSSATATYTFAVKYEVAGLTFWDDNGGKNHTLHVHGDGLLLGTPVLVAAANADGASGEVFGTVDVQNLAYAKAVTVVYTTDNWLTIQSAPAQYVPGPGSDNAEQWSFVLTGLAHQPLAYAISYEVGGVTYWDNNYGQNYSLAIP